MPIGPIVRRTLVCRGGVQLLHGFQRQMHSLNQGFESKHDKLKFVGRSDKSAIGNRKSALMAFDTVRANKLRSALTILGVSVGVVTVIFMVSIIQGLNKAFADQIESLGSNTIFISKFEPSFGRPPGPDEIHRKDLTMDDAEALRREAPS